jgi:hypothetical protein
MDIHFDVRIAEILEIGSRPPASPGWQCCASMERAIFFAS